MAATSVRRCMVRATTYMEVVAVTSASGSEWRGWRCWWLRWHGRCTLGLQRVTTTWGLGSG